MAWITCVSSMHCSSYYSEAFSPWKCSRRLEQFDTPRCLSLGLRWTYARRPQNLHLSFSRCSCASTSFNGLLLPGSTRMSLLTMMTFTYKTVDVRRYSSERKVCTSKCGHAAKCHMTISPFLRTYPDRIPTNPRRGV